MRYRDIRSSLDTLDHFLCSGTGFFSKIIQISGEYSHVLQVYRIPEHDIVMGWESAIRKEGHTSGVSLVNLSGVIDSYLSSGGRVVLRQVAGKREPELYTRLRDFRRQVDGTPYPENKIKVVKAWADKFGFIPSESISEMFCAQLSFETLEAAEWVIPANGARRTPTDFSEEAEDEPVRLIGGHSWMRQVEITDL